jgi:hypothetical protein
MATLQADTRRDLLLRLADAGGKLAIRVGAKIGHAALATYSSAAWFEIVGSRLKLRCEYGPRDPFYLDAELRTDHMWPRWNRRLPGGGTQQMSLGVRPSICNRAPRLRRLLDMKT